jgi:hypothetical protein
MNESEEKTTEYTPRTITYNCLNEQDPSRNFKISAETYEEALENALTELGFTLFQDWAD